MDKNQIIENLLKEYLDVEAPTQSRLEETIVIAKISEVIELLEKAIQPIRDGKSFDDFQIKSEIFDTVNKVNEILYEINLLLMAKRREKHHPV